MKPLLERWRWALAAFLGSLLLSLLLMRPTGAGGAAQGLSGWFWFAVAVGSIGWCLLRRRAPTSQAEGRLVPVARLPVDRHGVLHLVEVDGRPFLLSQCADGLRLLARLDAARDGEGDGES